MLNSFFMLTENLDSFPETREDETYNSDTRQTETWSCNSQKLGGGGVLQTDTKSNFESDQQIWTKKMEMTWKWLGNDQIKLENGGVKAQMLIHSWNNGKQSPKRTNEIPKIVSEGLEISILSTKQQCHEIRRGTFLCCLCCEWIACDNFW